MRALLAIIASAGLALPVSVVAAGGTQQRDPYANLFAGQLNVTPPAPPSPTSAPQFVPLPPTPPAPPRTVVCGITVVQGDAKIDPKMPQHPSLNAPKPVIGIFPAPACRK